MQSVVVAVIALFAVFSFLVRPAQVVGDSMLPNLRDGDWLAVSAFSNNPRRGEIIIITQPNKTATGEPIVKRVIATGGQSVDIDFDTGEVSVDGKVLNEPYIRQTTHRKFDVKFPLTVPEGYLFVMGDNRNDSLDSRSSRIGLIHEKYVLGRVLFRAFPFNAIGKVRYSTFDYQA